jgi:sugar phosphate isomerase/epimerase
VNAFGVSEFTTYPWDFERDVETLAEIGVRHIEVTEFKLDRARLDEQFELLAACGLTVSSVQAAIHSVFPDSLAGEPPAPGDRVRHIADSMRRIAPRVPAGTPFVVITGAAPRGDCDRAWRTTARYLRELARLAESLNVRVCFEPLNPILSNTDTAVWSLADGLDLVETVGHPACTLCVDLWNIWQTPDLGRVIERAGDRIGLVQISDWRRPRCLSDRVSIGDGVIPFDAIFAALQRTSYTGPYVLEIFSSESLPDSIWRDDLCAVILRNMHAFDRLSALVHA